MNHCPGNQSTLLARPSFFACALVAVIFCSTPSAARAVELWAAAYYTGASTNALPVSEIDFGTISHVILFSVVPRPDGSLDQKANQLEATTAVELTSRAHAAGRKALLCVGGAGSAPGFREAASPSHRAFFVTNLLRLMKSWNFDGLDLDWEPLAASDARPFTNLVRELRSALSALPQPAMLTAAVSAYPVYGDPPNSSYALFATLQGQLDQINIMTYDLSGAYPGWVSWFNSPLFDGGLRFSTSGPLVPSVNGAVANFLSNGVASSKLGIGVAFYGDVWTGGDGTSTGGVSLPRQSWTSPPTVTPIPFSEIISAYYQSNHYHWDTNAQAAYLTIDKPGSAGDCFISYDDEHTCQAKVQFAQQHHLGGIMIWQLAFGHRPDQPPGRRDPLLRAITEAVSSCKTRSP